MDLLRPIRSFDRYQQRHPAWAVPMAVIRKFGNDQAGSLAALIAYYAFFSIFPLLLVFTTILGFVLQGNKELYDDVTKIGARPVPGRRRPVAGPGADREGHRARPRPAHLAVGRAGRDPGGPERVRQDLGGSVQGPPRLLPLAAARPAAADVPGSAVRGLGRRHRTRDHDVLAARCQGRRVRDHAGGQLRAVRRRVPLPHRAPTIPTRQPVARARGSPRCSSRSYSSSGGSTSST